MNNVFSLKLNLNVNFVHTLVVGKEGAHLHDGQFKRDRHMNGVKKQDLPQKVCATCGRPFSWRKKWEKVWDEVKYCSDKCRRNNH